MTTGALDGERRDDETALEDVLDALHDPDCRAMLRELDDPKAARELSNACDIPSSTVYRKLDLLSDAGLIEERTTLREGFRHVTVFVRTFESVHVAAGEDDLVVEIEEREGAPADRLTEMWSQVQREV